MSRDGAQLRSARWAAYATVTFILVGMVGVGGVTALAASSTVGPFELALEARHERVPVSPTYPFGLRHIGTFTSSAPFCLSGTLVDLQVVAVPLTPLRARRELTCADGSGSLIVGINEPQLEHDSRFPGTWRIEEGTGRYASLRGRGEYRGELLGGDPLDPANVVFRASWQGVTDTDTVAPTLSVATARATKLRRPAGAYCASPRPGDPRRRRGQSRRLRRGRQGKGHRARPEGGLHRVRDGVARASRGET